MAACSAENGMEAFELHQRSVNSVKFLNILEPLIALDPNFVLFGDGAPWHTSKLCKKRFTDLDKRFLQNLKCVPQLNSIEEVFCLIKTRFKRLKLEQSLKVLAKLVVVIVGASTAVQVKLLQP